jgi:menaquinone-dependent protoporphyrinogen oxidase
MKILIAYSSKSGTTRECAEELAKKLSTNEVTLVDIEKDAPDVTKYEIAIVGGYVRMGKLCKAMKKFVSDNADVLKETMHAFFLCCGLPESTDYYLEKAISKDLLNSSISNMCFGGDLRIHKQKGLDKIIAKLILSGIKNNNVAEDMNEEMSIPAVVPENISRFADEIRRSF